MTPGGSVVKNLPEMQETWVWSLGWEDPWRRKWQPTPEFLPGNPMDRGAKQAKVHGVAQSQTRLSNWAHKEVNRQQGRMRLSVFILFSSSSWCFFLPFIPPLKLALTLSWMDCGEYWFIILWQKNIFLSDVCLQKSCFNVCGHPTVGKRLSAKANLDDSVRGSKQFKGESGCGPLGKRGPGEVNQTKAWCAQCGGHRLWGQEMGGWDQEIKETYSCLS